MFQFQHSLATATKRWFSVSQSKIGGKIGTAADEIGSYTLSRGNVGRKVFKKQWQHLIPRYPQTIQERWHRAPVERLFHPSIAEQVANIEVGTFHTFEYRIHFETTSLDFAPEMDKAENAQYKKLSPWHDIPIGFIDNQSNELLFNYINEIPKGERAKMECATDEEWNPIKQDTKKGKLRYFNYGDLPFNYGFIPQTWEDPSEASSFSDVSGLTGDGDPIDVVEISGEPISMAEVVPIKVLAVLGLIDEGETDWKIIALRADHPKIDRIHNIADAQSVMGSGDYQALILDWFRNYKVPDGKPQNVFTHNEQYQDSQVAIAIVEECYRQWYNLLLGATDNDKFSVVSVAHKHLLAQGLTTNQKMSDTQAIPYPRSERWQPRAMSKLGGVDDCEERTEMDEATPDQPRKTNN